MKLYLKPNVSRISNWSYHYKHKRVCRFCIHIDITNMYTCKKSRAWNNANLPHRVWNCNNFKRGADSPFYKRDNYLSHENCS